ncbi:MAG: hypothetical protein JNN05_09250 [Candidatus Omnitrophica bacterium]|nr:hypothetical protein [Candidatus Omnitrophota bacterium]
MKSKFSPCVGIYFSHYECFGHVSRVMAVADVFKKRFPKGSLFFVQAGVPQPIARLERWGRVYHLPHPYVSRRNFSRSSYVTPGAVEERSAFLKKVLIKENPTILITELFPLGREEARHELIPVLMEASRQGTVLWAIAGYPLLTDPVGAWREKVMDFYQQILILSPRMEKDYLVRTLPFPEQRQKYLGFYRKYHDKISFHGYLLPSLAIVNGDTDQRINSKPKVRDVCRVTVVRGGGVCYPKVIAQAIRASDVLGEKYFFNVVAGPSTTDQEWSLFCSLVDKKQIRNLSLYRSTENYEALIKESHVCVSIASYHSAVMLLKHSKNSIVIPFLGNSKKMSFPEQTARAKLLKKMIGAHILSLDQLTAADLAKSIRKVSLRKQKMAISEDWFLGERNLDQEFANVLGSH